MPPSGATEHPYTSPLVLELAGSDPSRDWPACAYCRQSVWMVDREQPVAFCHVFNGITFGEGRVITKCEAQEPKA